MVDFLNDIYEAIKDNKVIKELVDNRIAFYLYENYEDESKPFIVLRPLSASSPSIYGNDEPLRMVQDIQIDVQSRNRRDCICIMDAIQDTLLKLNIRQLNGDTLDEYFESVRRFCIAKRFRIKTKI